MSDVDSANVTVTLTLSNTAAGSLTTATSGAVTSTYNAGTGVWTASGAIASVNALLAGVTFQPAPNFNGSFTIATSVSDGTAPPVTGTKAITGIAVNDAPTATNLSAGESYTEDTPLNLTDIVVSDVDSANVTVTLTLSNTAAGSLTTATSGAVTSTYNAGTGVWTASGAIASVNALLAGVTFQPALNFNGSFTIATSVSDGTAPPVTGTKAITGIAVNDAPTATNLSAGESYTEDTPLNLTDIVVSDVDSANVTVTLTLSNTAAGSLTTATSGAVTSTYNAGTGVWTASGAIASVNALLAGVTFQPALNFNGSFTIATSVSDGTAPPVTGTKAITVNPVNDAPVSTDDAYAVNEDATLTVAAAGVLGNDSDVDGDALSAVLVTGPAHGSLTLNADGSFSYTPTANFYGADSFTYKTNDGTADGNTATVAITVNPVNDAPVSTDDAYAVNEDATLTVAAAGVLGNDSDVDGDALSAVLVTGPAHGSLTLNADGSFSYTPTANFYGADSFTYKTNDGTADGNTATVAITVNPVNDAPVSTDDAYAVNEDATLTVAAAGVLGNDSDVDGDALSAVLVTGPAHGSLTLNADGSFSYTPTANFYGADSFTYKTNDGTADGNTATVAITVNPVNDAPVSTDDAYAVNEDATLTVAAAGVLGNDSDVDGDALSAVLVTGPAHGSLTLNADGSFSYTPTANFYGADSFTYKTNDGTADGNTATVAITVNPVNDAPQVDNPIPDRASLEDTAFSYQVPANTFSDLDGDALTYSASRANGNPLPAWLTFNPVTRTFSGTPPLDYNGSINVRVTASDGTLSTSDAFTLTITPVDDPGIARTDRFTINDTGMVDANLFLDNGAGADFDPDNILQVGAVLRGAAAVGTNYVLPSGATVRIDSDGHILYSPGLAQAQLAAPGSGASNTSFVDTFSYSLVGGGTADVIVTVLGTDGYDTLLGTSGADSLGGGQFDDVLIGGLGSDALDGGAGIDTASYAGDQGAVFVNLTLGQGYGNSSFGDTYASIENVIGTAFNDFLIGDTGVNVLDGGAGNDTIIGGMGPDVLIGGDGIDLLSFEDNSGTVFVNLLTGMGYNNAAQGDTFTGFENVIGGLFDDTIIGDNGANRLDGAMGADTLVGNGGADTFVFAHAPGAGSGFVHPNSSANVDTIFDFVSGEDKLEINAAAFGGGLTPGSLVAGAFVVGSAAGDADDRFVYDQANGNLYFDADGSGAGAQVLMAILPNHDAIAATDFVIV